ncbi:MAG TPA: hypothetical protein VKQ72_06495, partial [Aggregatilineales bacterium]|nr:hypothetical protein [Aggregatilineales bacterium]
MADSKSSKSSTSKSKSSGSARTTSKPSGSAPGATGSSSSSRPSSKRSGNPANSPQLVKKEMPPPPPAPSSRLTPKEDIEFHPWLDPDRLGRLLHDRPAWIDELAAIVLVIFGLVSLFSLLSASQSSALAGLWSDTIRQFFGQIGAAMLSVMIMIAGVLVAFPRLGIHIRLPWSRVIAIEISYVFFLGVLHLMAHDPEPRALARSGQAGGFVGYLVTWPFFKLFGTDLALVCCIAIVVGAFCYAIGIRRPHIKAALLGASHRLEMLAERMKRPPQTSPHVRQAALATEPVGYESATASRSPLNVADLLSQPAAARHTPSTAEEGAPAQQTGMQPRPALSLPDMIAASKPPANPAKATAPRATQKSQPAPQPVPRRRRYFTVED